MRAFLLKGKSFWLVLGLLFLLPSIVVYAQNGDEDDEDGDDDEEKTTEVDPEAWKRFRDKVANDIRIEVDRRIKQVLTHQALVKQLDEVYKKNEVLIRKDYERQIAAFVKSEKKKWDDRMIPVTYPNIMGLKEFQKYVTIPPWKFNEDKSIAKPTESKEKIKARLEETLKKEFEKAYPLRPEKELKQEGRQKYPLIELTPENPRPLVKCVLRDGRGTNANVEGRLQRLNAERLQVQTPTGTRMLTRKDLSEETQALFYKDVNEKYVQLYVDEEIRKYEALRDGFITDWTQLILPNALFSSYYVPVTYLWDKLSFKWDEGSVVPSASAKKESKRVNNIRRQSTNLKIWWSRAEDEAKLYNVIFEHAKNIITPFVEKEIYLNAKELYKDDEEFGSIADDFVWRAKDKEWVTKKENSDRDKAEREAEANPNNGPEGPDGIDLGPGPM